MASASTTRKARRALAVAHRTGLQIAYPLWRAYLWFLHPRVTGVKCVVVGSGDRVLLIRHTYGLRDRWDLPGGGVRRTESPLEAARRETLEEVGIEVASLRPLGAVASRSNRRHVIIGYAGEAARREPEVDGIEIATARWFDRRELPDRMSPWARMFLAGGYRPPP